MAAIAAASTTTTTKDDDVDDSRRRILKKKKWQGVTQNSWSSSSRMRRRRRRKMRRTTVQLWCSDEQYQFWMCRLHKSINSQPNMAMHNDAAMCAWATKKKVNKREWEEARKKRRSRTENTHVGLPERQKTSIKPSYCLLAVFCSRVTHIVFPCFPRLQTSM